MESTHPRIIEPTEIISVRLETRLRHKMENYIQTHPEDHNLSDVIRMSITHYFNSHSCPNCNTNICPACDTKNVPQADFCQNCGARLPMRLRSLNPPEK